MSNEIKAPESAQHLNEQMEQHNVPTTGKFGRYQVVAKMPEADEKGMVNYSKYKLGVYAESVSLFDRIVNFFTGFLTREKHDAMIDFIQTGHLQAMEEEDGAIVLTDMEDLQNHYLDERIDLFRKIMSGETGATPSEQDRAIDALIEAEKDKRLDEDQQKRIHDVLCAEGYVVVVRPSNTLVG